MDAAKQAAIQKGMIAGQNQVSLETINEQNQQRLASQLKVVNQCREAREAIKLEVAIETMAISDKLKKLTSQIDQMEKAIKAGQPGVKGQVEGIKSQL